MILDKQRTLRYSGGCVYKTLQITPEGFRNVITSFENKNYLAVILRAASSSFILAKVFLSRL